MEELHIYLYQISTYVGFAALAQQNTQLLRGLQYTDVGAVTCAQSEMVLPLELGNLEKGERYMGLSYYLIDMLFDILYPVKLHQFKLYTQVSAESGGVPSTSAFHQL